MTKTKNAAVIGAMLALLAGCGGGAGSEQPTALPQQSATTAKKSANASAPQQYTKGIEALTGKESFW